MELQKQKGGWAFAVTIHDNSSPRQWSTVTIDNWFADKIVEHARVVVRITVTDDRVFLDGISLRCTVRENNTQQSYDFRCPVIGDPEWFLAGAFLVRAEHLFKDTELTAYLEELEDYFDKLHVKLYEETPRRLKIYGAFPERRKTLKDIIQQAAGEPALILDLTKLSKMWEMYIEALTPLAKIPDLKIWIQKDNASLVQKLAVAGFKEEQMIWL